MTAAVPFTTFLAPPAVLDGRSSTMAVGARLRTLVGGPRAVLVAADRFVRDVPAFDDLLTSLTSAGLEPVVSSDFGPELTAEQVDAAFDTARSARCAAVVGVGGGSVLDAAKMIAVLLFHSGSAREYLGTLASNVRRVPLVLAPTTVGTGAEVTRVSMVSVDGIKKIVAGDVLVPDLAVLDAAFVDGLPPTVIGSTGMDALAHAVEAVMSTARSATTEVLSFAAITSIVANLKAAYEGDHDARESMLTAAHLAGLSLNAGVVLGHSLAYSAARIRPMPHGTSCALALPYVLAYNQNLEAGLAARLASELTSGASIELEDAARAVSELARAVGQPTTLSEAGLPDDAVDEMARVCVGDYPRPTNPEPITLALVTQLVESMRTGDLTAAFAITRTETESIR